MMRRLRPGRGVVFIFVLRLDGSPISRFATTEKQYSNARQSTRREWLSMAATDVVIVLTTAPNDERADTWARTLVEERLAACVNLHGPMPSFYRCKGVVNPDAQL